MSGIRYCQTGCTTAGQRVQTEGSSTLCRRCEDQIHHWLDNIPDLYALLPTFVLHGSIDRNPDSKTTKAAEAQAPMRLEIIDLLDARRGRKWNGTAPATDRRGVVGTLKIWLDTLIEDRPLTTTKPVTSIAAACALLDRHRLWIAEQAWASRLHADLKQLHRELSDATGDYRRPPVGHCHVETDAGRCEGPLFANPHGGVHCARCRAAWDAEHLRQLGLAQAAANQEPA